VPGCDAGAPCCAAVKRDLEIAATVCGHFRAKTAFTTPKPALLAQSWHGTRSTRLATVTQRVSGAASQLRAVARAQNAQNGAVEHEEAHAEARRQARARELAEPGAFAGAKAGRCPWLRVRLLHALPRPWPGFEVRTSLKRRRGEAEQACRSSARWPLEWHATTKRMRGATMPGCSSASTPKKVHHALGEERSWRRAPSLQGFTRSASARSRVARRVVGLVLRRGLHDVNTRLARARAMQPSRENGSTCFCPAGSEMRRFFERSGCASP